MKLLVCLSVVPDTTTKIKFINNNTAIDKTGIQWVINPWDELVLTRALDLKDAAVNGIESVTTITVGLNDSEPTIRKALAIGADRSIRVNSEPKDSYNVAAQIAEVLKKESYDVILCGIESSDYNDSAIGSMLAEMLDIPSVSSVTSFAIEGGAIKLKREIEGGSESLTTPLPFLAVCQKGIAIEPRIPSMRGIMTARTKPLQVYEPVQSDVMTEYLDFELPVPKSACKKIDPENVKELVHLLHTEAKVI
jgi:electron transfer flavoprotein beta subunit